MAWRGRHCWRHPHLLSGAGPRVPALLLNPASCCGAPQEVVLVIWGTQALYPGLTSLLLVSDSLSTTVLLIQLPAGARWEEAGHGSLPGFLLSLREMGMNGGELLASSWPMLSYWGHLGKIICLSRRGKQINIHTARLSAFCCVCQTNVMFAGRPGRVLDRSMQWCWCPLGGGCRPLKRG